MTNIKEVDRQIIRQTAIEQAVKIYEATNMHALRTNDPDLWVIATAKQIEKYILGESS